MGLSVAEGRQPISSQHVPTTTDTNVDMVALMGSSNGMSGVAARHLALLHDKGTMQLTSAILYAVVATSMSLINRFALLVFPLPTIILLLQMLATLAILYPLLLAKALDFPVFRWTRFVQLFGIGALYTANTAFALYGLKAMNLPMYTAIKRLTPMTILVIKSVWKRSWPKASLTCSVMLVVVGCVIAGVGDLAFDAGAYAFAFSSVIMQALYLLLVEFQGDKGASSTSELLWYNALTALPLLSMITAAHGDVYQISALAAKGLAARGPLYFFTMVIGAATLGCLLNYSMFLCTIYNSALTTTIVGVLRGVATVLLGFMLDTVPFSVLNIAGITLNTCGGVWYTWIKYQDKLAGSSSSTAGLRKVAGGQGMYAKLPTNDDVEGHSTSVENPTSVSLRVHEGSTGGKVSVKIQT